MRVLRRPTPKSFRLQTTKRDGEISSQQHLETYNSVCSVFRRTCRHHGRMELEHLAIRWLDCSSQRLFRYCTWSTWTTFFCFPACVVEL
jgi:hypothetical protein